MMVSIQLKVWRLLTTNQVISLLPLPLPLPYASKLHITFPNFCTQTTHPSTTPPERGIVTEFLLNKCGLSEEDIAKAFRHGERLLSAKSTHNLEEVLQLLNGCGLTSSAQIRRVVLCNREFLFLRSERNLNSKLSFLRTFMTEGDISKLVLRNARIFNQREDKLKSAISLLQRLGVEGIVLSHLVAMQPRLLMVSEEKVIGSFKQAEDLGLNKGSKMFARFLNYSLGVAKETVERRLQCLSNLGFSEKQVSELLRRWPFIIGYSEENVKHHVDLLVKSVGVSLDDFVKNPSLFGYSLEKRVIPRYRVMEALKSIQGQKLRRKISLTSSFQLTEKRFLEKYVNSNAECSSVLLDIYYGGKAVNLIIDKETACLNQRDSRDESSETSSAPSI